MGKHGLNYKAMAKDIKLNRSQVRRFVPFRFVPCMRSFERATDRGVLFFCRVLFSFDARLLDF